MLKVVNWIKGIKGVKGIMLIGGMSQVGSS